MRYRTAISAFLACSACASAQLRVATWNISQYDGTTRTADIQRALYGTFNSTRFAPDVICVQEVVSASALNTLRTVFNTAPGYPNPPTDPGSPGDWEIATFVNGPDSESVLLYRSSRVVLVRDTTTIALGVDGDTSEQPRNTYRWDVRPFGYGAAPASTFGIYGVHLKAGSTSADNARRLLETTRIRNNAQGIDTNGPGTALPAGYHFMVMGDFNIQSSSQTGYQQLVMSLANNTGRSFDPIATPGSWNNSGTYAMIHTQDPGGAGGMDDRLDMILISGGLLDMTGMEYIGALTAPQVPVPWNLSLYADPNHSYRSYGNDGTSFNTTLTITGNQMVGSAIAQSLVNAGVSSLGPAGHLPVYLDVRVPPVASATASLDFGTVVQGSPSVQRTLVVSNAGNVALWNANGIATLAYSMAHPSGFSGPTGNQTDAAGGGVNSHTILMSTSTLGVRSGNITITTNDPERPTILVAVTGMVVVPNTPPTANAGPDQNLTDLDGSGTELVSLDGSASTDAGGSIVQYEWKEGTLVLATGPTATAQVPLSVGPHTITLIVTDNGGLTDDDTVLVTITEPPCDGDVNCDFALDGFDVEVQEKAVGGDISDYCQADPDFNHDFALDGFDVEAVELVVGGGPCP